jgi:predicted phosphodiesterase
MKTVFIGDIHGHDTWKKVVAKEQDANRFVFVGDYFDTHNANINTEIQINNFLDIMEFKKSGGKEVINIIGNHDFHYFPEIGENGCSGYQKWGKFQIEPVIEANRSNLQIAYQMGNILVTHAGVGFPWLNEFFDDWDITKLDELINERFKYQPHTFDYSDKDYSYCGNNINQTPLWIRPQALMSANTNTVLKQELIQIVGHTHQQQIDIKGKSTGGKYYFIDTMPREYLIYDGVEFKKGILE